MTIMRKLVVYIVLFLVHFLIIIPVPESLSVELEAMDENGDLNGPFAAVEVHASLFSDVVDWSILAGTFGYAAKGGYRWSSWGLFGQFEQNLWVATEHQAKVVRGAYNIGIGGELVYAQGFVRTSLALGPSILAFDTTLDKAGTTGFFVDLRPVGLKWAVHEYVVIGLDPLGIAIVAPVLDEIPLIYSQFRSVLYVEADF